VCLWIWLLRITSGLMRLRLFKLQSFLCWSILVGNRLRLRDCDREVWFKGWIGLERRTRKI